MNTTRARWVLVLVLGGCLDDDPGDPRGAGGAAGGDASASGGDGGGAGEQPAGETCVRTFVYRHRGAAATDVKLAGPFESPPWSAALPMGDEDGDGFWTAEVRLAPGRHPYKFKVDGQWITDPDNPLTVSDGGNTNSAVDHACPFAPGCLADGDCAEGGLVCRNLACVEPMAEPCECPSDQVCDDAGGCVPKPQCDDATPCMDGLVCRDGQCAAECTADGDCAEGSVCRDFRCRERTCATDADCPDPMGQTCDVECVANPCPVHVFRFGPGDRMPRTVHVAGSFNADAAGNWPATIAAGGWEMPFDPALGVFWTKRALPNGTHRYKFVLDDGAEWIADPENPEGEDDGFGGRNSLLTVDCADAGPGACGDLAAFDWRDAVMYFVMVDRFYDADGQADPVPGATGGDARSGPSGQYVGGDLAGVAEKLPYLQELGVTALWLSAPYENRDTAGAAIDPQSDQHQYSGYHGYWPSPPDVDFGDPDAPRPEPQVESRIGTADDLRGLIDQAHADGVKVLFDYVMGHVDIESGLYQAHQDWFVRDNGRFRLCGPENLWDDDHWGTRCAFTDYLPKFDFYNPTVRDWSVSDAVWWAKAYDLDGYRLDAIKHQPLEWLRELRARLNAEIGDPDGGRFYLVGETFAYDDRDLLKRFVDPATLLDGQFDFPYKARLCEALFTPGGRLDTFAGWLGGNDGFYGPGAIMTTWIGNHDIPRAIHFASREIGNCREGSHPGNGWSDDYPQPGDAAAYERLGLAFAVMLTNPGIPLIYYGDEIGLAGGGDPDNRRLMPWDDASLSAAQRAMRAQIAALGRIRAENKVLARGRRVPLSADQDTWVFRMTGCGAQSPDVTVAVNRADAPRTVEVPAGTYLDLLAGGEAQGGRVEVPARGLRVLRGQ